MTNHLPGSSSPLSVVLGSFAGASLSVRHDGRLVVEHSEAGLRHGRIEEWSFAAVITKRGNHARFWHISPGLEMNEIVINLASVRGFFKVESRTNNAQEARSIWKAFGPAPVDPSSDSVP